MLPSFLKKSSWRLSAPSWVRPGTAAENCRFLAPHFPDIGLYFLETKACLAYTAEDIPEKTPGLSFHMHLPLDLPWERGPDRAHADVEALVELVRELAPWGFVLHHPGDSDALAQFVALWRKAGRDSRDLLLENTEGVSGRELLRAAKALDAGLCLDLGHLQAFGREEILDAPDVFLRTRMLHVYAPWDMARREDRKRMGNGHRHRSLAALDRTGRGLLRRLLENVPRDAAVVFEVFSEKELRSSLAAFAGFLEQWGMRP